MGFLSTDESDIKPLVTAQHVAVDPNLQNQQQAFATALQQQTQGKGPSAAGMMLQQQAQQNAANANAMAAGQRGVNPGLAMRQAQMAGAQGNQQAAQQAALSRVQEQLGSQGQYGGLLGQMQGQNLQAQQANQNANLQAQGINTGAAVQTTQNQAGMAGNILSSIGGAAGLLFSDERAKSDVKDGAGDAYAFLDALSAHKYKYKNPDAPGASHGEQLGVMAQDLEKTPAGDHMVRETPQGKMVDPAKGFGAVLAAQSDLHERLKALEGKKMASGGIITDPTQYLPTFGGTPPKGQTMGMPKLGGKEDPTHVDAFNYSGPNQAGGPALDPSMMLASRGGKVAGRAQVQGDSENNDTVHAMLSPGEIVVPRSASTDAEKAKEFIDELMKKKRGHASGGSSYSKVLTAHRALGEALKGLGGKG